MVFVLLGNFFVKFYRDFVLLVLGRMGKDVFIILRNNLLCFIESIIECKW